MHVFLVIVFSRTWFSGFYTTNVYGQRIVDIFAVYIATRKNILKLVITKRIAAFAFYHNALGARYMTE